ncbi:hypothetical protein L2V99_24590, partial [Escherichia coli]|uniref:FimD/PapC C-terminal domain-containing protein n=1 Tax=Escherichia coli TaxID=562 RepID=UPI002AC353E0
GAGRTSDGNGSHASTLKSPSYTKSVSWQHYPNSLADNVELDETVVTVIPTHGAIARATFNAQIGGKVLMTLKYGNKSVPFGAIVTHGENKNGSIVAENGQVYLTGLPQSGKLQVSWGNDKNSNCIVDYKLPEVSPGTLLNQQTAICR